MSLQQTCVLSYGLAAVAFMALAILLATAWRGRLQGALLTLAVIFSSLWALFSAVFCYAPDGAEWLPSLMNASEAVRDLLWIAFFALLLFGKDELCERVMRHPALMTGMVVSFFLLLVLTVDFSDRVKWAASGHSLALFFAMIFAISGLVLVEQGYRKAQESGRAHV